LILIEFLRFLLVLYSTKSFKISGQFINLNIPVFSAWGFLSVGLRLPFKVDNLYIFLLRFLRGVGNLLRLKLEFHLPEPVFLVLLVND
jgi:hypothetical protein